MALQFKRAARQQKKLRLNIDGISGSGKTLGALRIARGLSPTGRIAVLDTENNSASLYAAEIAGGYEVAPLTGDMRPREFTSGIHDAEEAGFDVIIVDSLSHAWRGTLELVDRKTEASRSKNAFNEGWRAATPEHNALVDAILKSKAHVITTMRSKSEYVLEENEKGQKVPRKIGMAPVAREGAEYEYDVCLTLNADHKAVVSKTRCKLLDEQVIPLITEQLGAVLRVWLESGEAVIVSTATPASEAAPATTTTASPSVRSAAAPEATAPASKTGESQSATAERDAVILAKELSAADDKPALDKVVDKIAAAVKSGKVDAAERKQLLALYTQRNNAVASRAA